MLERAVRKGLEEAQASCKVWPDELRELFNERMLALHPRLGDPNSRVRLRLNGPEAVPAPSKADNGVGD